MNAEHEVQVKPLLPQERREFARLVRKRLRQMVEPFDSTSPWWSWDDTMDRFEPVAAGYHSVTMPSMLVQIEAAFEGIKGTSGATGSFESRPTAALDAIDAYERIKHRAADAVKDFGGERGVFVETNLNLLASLASELSDEQLRALRRMAMSWWTQAKIVAGFEERAQRPHVRCPRCEAMDSLRVRLDVVSRFGLAMCTECEAAWTDDPESQRENGDGDIRMLLREIDRQETEQAAGSIDASEIHEHFKFLTKHDARRADPKGDVRNCDRCSTPADRVRKIEAVVVEHVMGKSHFCSRCVCWHPGRPAHQTSA